MSQRPGSWDRPIQGAPLRTAAQLIRLHRHSLANLLVLGGTSEERAEVARGFHQGSPLHAGPVVAVDCRSEEARLRSSLESLLACTSRTRAENPMWSAARGTLFLDSIESLSEPTQRLLLTFAERFAPGRDEGQEVEGIDWVGRLSAGSSEDPTIAVAEGRFLEALYDHLDKIRVELGPVRHVGVA